MSTDHFDPVILVSDSIYLEEDLADMPRDGTIIWVLTSCCGSYVVQRMYAGVCEDDTDDGPLRWFILPENVAFCDAGPEHEVSFVAWGHVERPMLAGETVRQSHSREAIMTDWADEAAKQLTPAGQAIPELPVFRASLAEALHAAHNRGYDQKAAEIAKEQAMSSMQRKVFELAAFIPASEGTQHYAMMKFAGLIADEIDELGAQLPQKDDGK